MSPCRLSLAGLALELASLQSFKIVGSFVAREINIPLSLDEEPNLWIVHFPYGHQIRAQAFDLQSGATPVISPFFAVLDPLNLPLDWVRLIHSARALIDSDHFREDIVSAIGVLERGGVFMSSSFLEWRCQSFCSRDVAPSTLDGPQHSQLSFHGRDMFSALDGHGVIDLPRAMPVTKKPDVSWVSPPAHLPEISEIEHQIAVMLLDGGKTYKDIAATVYLSEDTIKRYVGRIADKLGVQRRRSCVMRALARLQVLDERLR